MRTQASFQQILEERLQARRPQSQSGQGIEQETETHLFDQDPAHLAFLMGSIGPSFFRPQANRIYPARPKPPPPPHSLTEGQQKAYNFFILQGAALNPAFTSRELKKAFRALALKLHPDTNKGATVGPFLDLKNNYETLSEIFS